MKINLKRTEDGLAPFANARNAATGGLRTKDSQETSRRGIEAVIYQVGYLEDAFGQEVKKFTTHDAGIHALDKMGFKWFSFVINGRTNGMIFIMRLMVWWSK